MRSALAALTTAQRARTAVAAADAALWNRAGHPVLLPFVEQGGSLLLLTTGHQRQHLLEFGAGCVDFSAHALGSVRLSGDFWPVADQAARSLLDDLQPCHPECRSCPGRQPAELVGLQVDLVELSAAGGGYRRVDLDAYVVAQPDWVLAVGVNVQQHLNTAHSDEVRAAAAALAGRGDGQVLAAQLEWVDRCGFELSAVDETGGRWLRSDFPRPVFDPDQLSTVLHDCLARVIERGPGSPPSSS